MATKFFFKPQTPSALIMSGLKTFTGLQDKKDLLKDVYQFAKEQLMLPVNPQSLEITTTSDNKKVNVVKSGQIVIPRGVELSTLTIESFFPKNPPLVSKLLGSYTPGYIITTIKSLIFGNYTAEQYFRYFEKLQRAQVPVRLVISDCNVDMDVLVESIKKRYDSQDDDLYYTLNLIEYRPHKLKELTAKTVSSLVQTAAATKQVTSSTQTRIKTGFAIGDKVIVNGKYCYDSFGAEPFGTFSNFQGKISHISTNKNATNKYHITTLDGKWYGWVKQEQLTGV